ncbi:putative CWF19-like protein 1 like protein [Fusarium oxysporum f. sp. albedinis]|nr:Ran-binding protein 10 [Fusarium oxysporum f. sp. albedinis]KAJ0137265.1 putative CWF19-like protein 1 like protein [Fusarium oxysporum f. sp. albedinis]
MVSMEPRELDQALCSYLSEVIERERTYWETVNQLRLSSKDMDSGTFGTTSIWMERTRWQDIYEGARRDILQALTRLPDRRALAIDYFLGQGNQESDLDIVSSSRADRTSRFLLCWLNSTRLQHFHERPFSLVAEKTTERKYRNVQKRLLAFAFRTHMMTARVNNHRATSRRREMALEDDD